MGLYQLRTIARQGSRRSRRQALLQGDGALRSCHRRAQHQRAQRAEELRDGRRRLYRPVFDPERQRATDRLPAVRSRRRHSAQSPGARGRQDRGRPLPAQHDERQGAGDARLRPGADVPAALLACDHAMGRRAATQVDGQARRLFRPARALSAGLDPVRPTVLGREDSGCLVHVGSVRRLLRLQRRRAPRRRQARRAELADRRLRRAGFRQSRRPGTDRRRAEVAAGLARQCAHAFRRRQDPSLAVVGQCTARRTAGARRHDQPQAGSKAAPRPGRGRRLSVRIRPSTGCSIPPMPPPTSSSPR